jgi:hypothetical protein
MALNNYSDHTDRINQAWNEFISHKEKLIISNDSDNIEDTLNFEQIVALKLEGGFISKMKQVANSNKDIGGNFKAVVTENVPAKVIIHIEKNLEPWSLLTTEAYLKNKPATYGMHVIQKCNDLNSFDGNGQITNFFKINGTKVWDINSSCDPSAKWWGVNN